MVITSSPPRGRSGLQSGGKTPAALTGLSAEVDFSLPFQHRLTVPKNTAIATPYEYVMPLPIGRIQKLWVEMPAGCQGLVGLQVWRRVYQIFPLPEGQWFISDDTMVNFAFTHSVHNEPYEVILKAYNLDDTYQHQPWIAFEMTGLKNDLPPELAGLVDYLKGA